MSATGADGRRIDVARINELFDRELVVVNMGLEVFAASLRQEQVRVLQMDWRPPAGGSDRLLSLLRKLGR
jgi:hypothetical protein